MSYNPISIGTTLANHDATYKYDQPAPVNNQFPFTGQVYEIEQRMQTIENSGMTCLGVFQQEPSMPAVSALLFLSG